MNKKATLLSEPFTEWGGNWTEKKLNDFAKYVTAYLTIMKNQQQWKTIYFDGFAGSGNRKETPHNQLYKQLQGTSKNTKIVMLNLFQHL
jgi:hypothetical protein